MSQHDYDIANADGATVRADINSLVQAIAELNSGATAPSVTFANMWWADTTASILKRRNNANNAWISVMSLTTGLIIGTDVQAYDADTSKTDVAETRSANINMADNEFKRPEIIDYGETVNIIGSIGGGTQDIDLESGNVVTGTVDTSTTTFTFSNPPASGSSGSFTFIVTNGGSQTVNWPASVDWVGGTAPTLTSSGVDVLTFFTVDGGTIWYGFEAGLDMQ